MARQGARRRARAATDGAAATPVNGWERIDLDALLVALVLVPQTFPRNRFFELYRLEGARNVRRRAALLRSLVTDMLGDDIADVGLERSGGEVQLSYRLVQLEARRLTVLSELELSTVALALERVGPRGELVTDAAADEQVRALLPKLLGDGC